MSITGQRLFTAKIIQCTHPDHLSHSVDFSEFWNGTSRTAPERRSNWKGDILARPELADAIWRALRQHLAGRKPSAFLSAVSALRAFFRFLDAYEAAGHQPIASLEDIRMEHSILWLNPLPGTWEPPNQKRVHNIVGALIRTARKDIYGPQDTFDWHPFHKRNPINRKELPSEPETREALALLKSRARDIFARWKRADELASQGRNLLDIRQGKGRSGAFDFEVSEADLHTTYREVVKRTGDPIPSVYLVTAALGHAKGQRNIPSWWPAHPPGHARHGERIQIDELIAGLYPSIEDIQTLLLLFIARTGWNASTAVALDISDGNWAQLHGDASSGLWRIESMKERANSWQWTLSQEKTTTGAYQIIKVLLDRTSALRSLVLTSPERSSHPSIAARSPWLAAGSSWRTSHVFVQTSEHVNRPAAHWKKLVKEHNASAPLHRPRVPEWMTPSHWRDIYADFVFRDSRYSWVMVQWALGHKHMRTTRHYLRSRLWRQSSEKKLSHLVTTLINGIEVNARIDFAVIRAEVDLGLKVDKVALDRLDLHRVELRERDLSYTGHFCTSPFTPPRQIDPTNSFNGLERCKRGERCTSCPQGLAVDSSLMCKRVAELKWLKNNTNDVIWHESHYACDLDSLLAELTQWPDEDVASQIRHWQEKIAQGHHRVLRFGGN